MERDVQALDVVCKAFQEYRSDELVALRQEIYKLKKEILHLRICLVINSALLKEWLRYQRQRSGALEV